MTATGKIQHGNMSTKPTYTKQVTKGGVTKVVKMRKPRKSKTV